MTANTPSVKKDSILILDIDGTLTDSIVMHQEALLGAMQTLMLEHLNTDWGSYPHHTDTGIFTHAMEQHGRAGISPDQRASFERDLGSRFSVLLAERGLCEIAGARAFVKAMETTRWGVVFATGGIRSVSRQKLHAVAIDFVEEALLTSSEHAARDDLVEAARVRAMHLYDMDKPRAVVSVGDGLWDMRVASALGLGFVGIGSPDSASGRALRTQGATVVDDLGDVIRYLESS